MKTKAIVDKARKLCDFLNNHNKNLTKVQYDLFLDLKEEFDKENERRFKEAVKMKEIELRNEKVKRANQLRKQLIDADEKRMMMVWNVGNKKGGRK